MTKPKGEDIPIKQPYGNPSLSKLQFSYEDRGTMHRVAAHDPERTGPDAGKPVGFLQWRKSSGEIDQVGTHPSHARMGLATHLVGYARGLSEQSQPAAKPMKGQRSLFKMPAEKRAKPIIAPEHSPIRTEEGDKWARSVGGYLPNRRMR